jgi:hypothetical protein
MAHFDPYIYNTTSSSLLYKILSAACGDSGVGQLLKEIGFTRGGAGLETIYFNDLDYVFGNLSFLGRTTAEQYAWDPMTDMLNASQWDEVRVKDAHYRARVKGFFKACGLGGTPAGIRECIQAAISVDCDIYENWEYLDYFGGAAPGTRVGSRSEVVVVPHKASLAPEELRLCRDMLDKLCPLGAVITIAAQGLATDIPITVNSAASPSVYYEVQKVITPTPVLANIPIPASLANALPVSAQWMFSGKPTQAPTVAFNSAQAFAYCYVVGGGKTSAIDSVTYGTLQPDGTVKTEPNYSLYNQTGTYTPWMNYEKADSSDNYPGGKFGLHPGNAPAVNPDGSAYNFKYPSQLAYNQIMMAQVRAAGGLANATQYCFPIQKAGTSTTVFTPDLAIAYSSPARSSTVTTSGTYRRGRRWIGQKRNLAMFIRVNTA